MKASRDKASLGPLPIDTRKEKSLRVGVVVSGRFNQIASSAALHIKNCLWVLPQKSFSALEFRSQQTFAVCRVRITE